MRIGLEHYLMLSGVLFAIGAAGFLMRRNALIALMCIELMLNSVNLTLVAFNRWQPATQVSATATEAGTRAQQRLRDEATQLDERANQATTTEARTRLQTEARTAREQAAAIAQNRVPMIPHRGQLFAFFVIAVAAAEAALGLAIVLALYRVRKTVRTDDADLLRG